MLILFSNTDTEGVKDFVMTVLRNKKRNDGRKGGQNMSKIAWLYLWAAPKQWDRFEAIINLVPYCSVTRRRLETAIKYTPWTSVCEWSSPEGCFCFCRAAVAAAARWRIWQPDAKINTSLIQPSLRAIQQATFYPNSVIGLSEEDEDASSISCNNIVVVIVSMASLLSTTLAKQQQHQQQHQQQQQHLFLLWLRSSLATKIVLLFKVCNLTLALPFWGSFHIVLRVLEYVLYVPFLTWEIVKFL